MTARTPSMADLCARILLAAAGGSTRTKIMSDVFVEFNMLRQYLESLTEDGLLDASRDFKTFRTSAKGLRYLLMFDNSVSRKQFTSSRPNRAHVGTHQLDIGILNP